MTKRAALVTYYQHPRLRGVAVYINKFEDNIATTQDIHETTPVEFIMVGDDEVHYARFYELKPLKDEELCGGCGQIGCNAYC